MRARSLAWLAEALIAEYEHVQRVAASQECGKLLSIVAYRLGSDLRASGPDHKDHYPLPSADDF